MTKTAKSKNDKKDKLTRKDSVGEEVIVDIEVKKPKNLKKSKASKKAKGYVAKKVDAKKSKSSKKSQPSKKSEAKKPKTPKPDKKPEAEVEVEDKKNTTKNPKEKVETPKSAGKSTNAPRKPLNEVTNTRRNKIRNVFLCHKCTGEFSSREERQVHACLPDITIEEVEDPYDLEGGQTEPIVTFPEDENEEFRDSLPPLEQKVEDPKALKSVRKCPICLAKFGTKEDVEQHMYVIHVISLENQRRLADQGLAVADIDISNL